ncbi:MAG: hypothetical protein IPL01_23090 [Acidobacteria bacterium]|nr:hypothetical protein [Acidobacteriota bacterium]
MTRDRFFIVFWIWRIFYSAVPLLVMAAVAWRRPGLCRGWFRALENGLNRVARNHLTAGLLIFLISLTISIALSMLVHWPGPVIADEFSYLLASDTFAHGRLTNPPHPMWRHFESLHIIQQPTYASKYPPGQGLVMAAGQVLTGQAIAGVWVSVALACVAIFWMLLAFTRPRHALLGGLLAAIHPIILEWGQNYWGGAVALGGGAIVIGAFQRLCHRTKIQDGLMLGAGLAILANTRPFEGMVLALLLGLLTIFRLVRGELHGLSRLIIRVALPAALILIIAGGSMAFYNMRVSGHPLLMPYLLHEENYAVAPAFVWQKPRPDPLYRHDSIRLFYTGYALESYTVQKNLPGFIKKGLIRKIGILLRGYISNLAMAFPLLALPWAWRRDKWLRVVMLTLAGFIAVLLTETWMVPHYAAPGAPLIFIAVVLCFRYLRVWKYRGQRTGLWLARAVVLFSILGVVNLGFRLARDQRSTSVWAEQRARIQSTLEADSALHLIIVRYGPQHVSHQEWVFNSADPDRSRVIWAREMDQTANHQLINYFPERKIWLLEADQLPPSLKPLH